MQTFPSVFLHNILTKKPSRFRERGETPAQGAGVSGKFWIMPEIPEGQAAPSPVREPPAVTAPVKQLTK